ncbi:histidine kinase [Roseivirga sp.]|uniref:histidine kinase n=1 Tax=Roseivirga sp. TaxID=1964215 RepID=UPI003B51E16D
MKRRPIVFLLLVNTLLLLVSCSQDPERFKTYETLYKVGDRPQWALKDWNDDDWQRGKPELNNGQIFWYRKQIDVLESPEPFQPYGLRLEVYGEYEVFWDGVLIKKNGNPGQEAELPPEGKLWVTFSIPTHLTTKGEHMLAIRSSLFHFPDHGGIYDLTIDSYDKLLTNAFIKTSYMHVFAGAFLIISFYYLFLFFNSKRDYSMLIFSVCCFLIFALVVMVFSQDYFPIHYGLHVVRLQIINSFLLGISFLIPLYFSRQFPFSGRRLVLILYTLVLIYIYVVNHNAFDYEAISMVLSMWCISFGMVAYGVYQKIRGAHLVLLTLLLSVVIFLTSGFNTSLYTGLGLILLGMLYLLSVNIKAQRLAYEYSLVQSTRLQLELLKKNLQPHFLMNTLTSLIDWVEEAPEKGVLFIEALAEEFDLFNQIKDQKLIAISKEISLCRTHMEIMKYRKEINYCWHEEGIDYEQQIPPAIFHTLLENGITHSLPMEDNSISFKLIYESNNNGKSYTFLTFAKLVRQTNHIKEGTGLKYIKARLTESYGSKWDLISEPTEHSWKNVIKIYS